MLTVEGRGEVTAHFMLISFLSWKLFLHDDQFISREDFGTGHLAFQGRETPRFLSAPLSPKIR